MNKILSRITLAALVITMVPAHAEFKDSMSNALDFMRNNRVAVVTVGIIATAIAFYKGKYEEDTADVISTFTSNLDAHDIRLINDAITTRLNENEEINLSQAFYRNIERERMNDTSKELLKLAIERYNKALKKQKRLHENEPGAELAEFRDEKKHLTHGVYLINQQPELLRTYTQKHERNARLCYTLAATCGAGTLASYLVTSH